MPLTELIDTDTALAAACHVNRRRIYKWRAIPIDPAPVGLDIVQWLDWLQRTGHRKAHAHLSNFLAPAAVPAPESPPASKPFATYATNPGDLDADAPPLESTLPLQEAWWKAKGSREKALAAARVRAREERETVPITIVNAALVNLATAAIEALGQTIWLTMRPSLDGIATSQPALIKTLRASHDAGVAAVRASLAAAVPAALTKAFTNQENQ